MRPAIFLCVICVCIVDACKYTLGYIQGMSLSLPHSLERESNSEPGVRLVAREPPVCLSWGMEVTGTHAAFDGCGRFLNYRIEVRLYHQQMHG